MTQETVHAIAAKFGLTKVSVSEPQKGYRNSSYLLESKGQKYNLIVFKKEPDALKHIRGANGIGTCLQQSGLPVRYPVDQRVLRVFAGEPPTYAGLYNYLPGATIPWEAYTSKHLIALGRALSDLHEALQQCEGGNLPQVTDVLLGQSTAASRYFRKSGVKDALSQKLGLTVDPAVFAQQQQLINTIGQTKHPQPLHMDFVRGNILFDDKAVLTGIIDFEKAAIGHPLFDIARTAAFLRVDCKYKDGDSAFHIFFNRGYRKRGGYALPKLIFRGEDRTLAVLDELITYFLTYDFYKFLLHTPYESLMENEHFVRTQAELLKRNVLTKV